MAMPTRVQTPETLRDDFDRLALLPDGWNHNRHYHRWLLRHVPAGCEDGLDAGCGTGEFARQLALRCKRVLGIDLSPGMIDRARRRSAGRQALEFQVADLMDESSAARFDCIATIATLHHLPLEPALARLAGALRSGGVLLVLDVVANRNAVERAWAARAMPVATALCLWHRRRPSAWPGMHTAATIATPLGPRSAPPARECCRGRECGATCCGATRSSG